MIWPERSKTTKKNLCFGCSIETSFSFLGLLKSDGIINLFFKVMFKVKVKNTCQAVNHIGGLEPQREFFLPGFPPWSLFYKPS